jgi:hypothetical protein
LNCLTLLRRFDQFFASLFRFRAGAKISGSYDMVDWTRFVGVDDVELLIPRIGFVFRIEFGETSAVFDNLEAFFWSAHVRLPFRSSSCESRATLGLPAERNAKICRTVSPAAGASTFCALN